MITKDWPNNRVKTENSKNKKYFLDQDNDCHWYIIPADKREAWVEFCNIPEDDEESWKVPDWAKPIGGHPNRVEFEDYTY